MFLPYVPHPFCELTRAPCVFVPLLALVPLLSVRQLEVRILHAGENKPARLYNKIGHVKVVGYSYG